MSAFNPVRKTKVVRERDVETAFRERVKALGGIAIKLTAASRSALPDRMAVMPGGVIRFVELKAPGEKPTVAQQREHERMRALGFWVEVIDSVAVAKSWVP